MAVHGAGIERLRRLHEHAALAGSAHGGGRCEQKGGSRMASRSGRLCSGGATLPLVAPARTASDAARADIASASQLSLPASWDRLEGGAQPPSTPASRSVVVIALVRIDTSAAARMLLPGDDDWST